ncbi:MAG: GIY-YIG nuclease family protein [Trichloromonadaceae bacterium]
MKRHDFVKIGDWYFNENGRLDIDFPSTIENTPGVIAMVLENEPIFFSATIHYGPRVKDFKHTVSGDTTKARIHHLIEACLRENKKISLWVKDTNDPHPLKRNLIQQFNPRWNRS